MLDVMDKKTTVQENINAIKLCYKYNIFTIIGLVIGMPWRNRTDNTGNN